MYALYIFSIRTEISRVIDFILEEDTGNFIPDEIRGLDAVGTII